MSCVSEQKPFCRTSANVTQSSADVSLIQSLKEKTASLQAALTNSESKKRSLELEVANLRNDMESLRMETSNSASLSHMERQIQEVSFRAPQSFHQLIMQADYLLNSVLLPFFQMIWH